MRIVEVTENKKQYLDLLLLADEQEDLLFFICLSPSVRCNTIHIRTTTDKQTEDARYIGAKLHCKYAVVAPLSRQDLTRLQTSSVNTSVSVGILSSLVLLISSCPFLLQFTLIISPKWAR